MFVSPRLSMDLLMAIRLLSLIFLTSCLLRPIWADRERSDVPQENELRGRLSGAEFQFGQGIPSHLGVSGEAGRSSVVASDRDDRLLEGWQTAPSPSVRYNCTQLPDDGFVGGDTDRDGLLAEFSQRALQAHFPLNFDNLPPIFNHEFVEGYLDFEHDCLFEGLQTASLALSPFVSSNPLLLSNDGPVGGDAAFERERERDDLLAEGRQTASPELFLSDNPLPLMDDGPVGVDSAFEGEHDDLLAQGRQTASPELFLADNPLQRMNYGFAGGDMTMLDLEMAKFGGMEPLIAGGSSAGPSSPALMAGGVPAQVNRLHARPTCSECLRLWIDNLNEHEHSVLQGLAFRQVLDLHRVEIDWQLLGAAIRHWRPEFNTFIFNNVELGPSLEELSRLTSLPSRRYATFPPATSKYADLLWRFFGIHQIETSPGCLLGSASRFTLRQLYNNFSVDRGAPHSPRSEHCINALIFCVLAELLFSGWPETSLVDLLAILQLVRRRNNGAPSRRRPNNGSPMKRQRNNGPPTRQQPNNVVSIVLAETFCGLTECFLGRTQVLRGCCAFLQLWLWEHLGECLNMRSATYLLDYNNDDIIGAILSSIPARREASEELYGCLLQSVESCKVIWEVPRLHQTPVICAGDRSPLILAGLDGYFYYHPSRILRQFGIVQNVHRIDLSGPDCSDYHLHSELRKRVREKWRKCLDSAELGLVRQSSSFATEPNSNSLAGQAPDNSQPNLWPVGVVADSDGVNTPEVSALSTCVTADATAPFGEHPSTTPAGPSTRDPSATASINGRRIIFH